VETCEWRLSQLHRLAEGELRLEDTPGLEDHLRECPHCSGQLQAFEETKSLLQESLAAEFELPDAAVIVAHSKAEAGTIRYSRYFAVLDSIFPGGFFKKAFLGAAACVAMLILAAGVFAHFYFHKTFPYELDRVVLRCSDGIEARDPGGEWRPLLAGSRLEKGMRVRTPATGQSFLSAGGIRLLVEGESEFEVRGKRILSVEQGELFVASDKRKQPLTIRIGDASVRADDAAFRIARSGNEISIGVSTGTLSLTTSGTTDELIPGQTVTFGGTKGRVMLASANTANPFASLKVPVIERIKKRFASIMSKYISDYQMARMSAAGFGGIEIPETWSNPQAMYRFASYSPSGSLRFAQANAATFSDYYESLFVPSNRSLSIGRQKLVNLRSGRGPSFPQWSHDGSMIAFVESKPYTPEACVRVVRLDDLDNPWDISQVYNAVLPFLPLTWAPDNRHVLYMVANLEMRGKKDWYWNAPYRIKIAPIDPSEGPVRDFNSPFHDIPLKLPFPVGKTISPRIVKLPWGDAMLCCNWGNIGYIPIEEDGQAVTGAPGLFLTDFDPRKMFVMMAVWSPSGNKILFGGLEDLDFDEMKDSPLYILYDVEDIIDGFSEPPRSLNDPRIKSLAPSDACQIPGGFSFDESLIFFDRDVNDAWRPMYPTDIRGSDFDLYYANALPDQPGQPTQIHLPGNQMFLQPSPEGNRAALCNHIENRYELRVISFDIEAIMDMDLGGVLIDNSGTNLIVPPGTLEENFNVQISTSFTIEEEAEIAEGESHFFSMRLLDAQGLENPKFIEPMTLTIRYTEDEVAGLDEAMLDIYYYDESDPDNPVWVPLGATVDPEHNEITVEIRHFSKYAVGGKRPQ